jgi:DNA-binding XRE family transcriptional regulator
MTFPEKLKTHRERLGLTQAELASFLDVSPRAVWQWEKGKVPHVLTQEGALARLAKV